MVELLRTALAAALSAVLLVGTASAQTGCHAALAQLGASQRSTRELAALCRARVPASICSDALRVLGEKPWATEDIDNTCASWESDHQMRLLKDMKDAGEDAKDSIADAKDDMDKSLGSGGKSTPSYDSGSTMDDISESVTDAKDSAMDSATGAIDNAKEKAGGVLDALGGDGEERDALTGKAELLGQPAVAAPASHVPVLGAGLLASVLVGASLVLKRAYRVPQQQPILAEDALEGANME